MEATFCLLNDGHHQVLLRSQDIREFCKIKLGLHQVFYQIGVYRNQPYLSRYENWCFAVIVVRLTSPEKQGIGMGSPPTSLTLQG